MKHSIGRIFTAGTNQTIFTVPQGYVAHASLVFITNTSGSTGSYTLGWKHAHNPSHVIKYAYGKSLNSGDAINYSSGVLVMKAGDSMILTNTMTVDIIITFDLLQAMPLYTFDGE